MTNIEEIVKSLNKVGNVEICYSDITHKFFIFIAGVYIKENNALRGITEHRGTVFEALEAYYNCLKGNVITINKGKDYIVL